MVDDAVELFVCNEAGEAGTDLERTHRAEVFQSRQTDRCEPDFRPRKGRHHEEGEELPTEDLVTNRFVEQGSRRKAGGPTLTLVENALGFE